MAEVEGRFIIQGFKFISQIKLQAIHPWDPGLLITNLPAQPLKRSWVFSRDVTLLRQFRTGVNDFLGQFDMDVTRRSRMILCVDEAAANIIEHSCPKANLKSAPDFQVEASYNGQQILVVFRDNGIPFNPTKAPLIDIKNHVRSGQRGGLGVHIMRSFLDVFTYEYDSGKNIFTLGMNAALPYN